MTNTDTPVLAPDAWATLRRITAWIDNANGHSDHETAMRLLKLAEEVGEVTQAYIGMIGQNPRKGITHTQEDVADELCDVVVTALVALYRFADDPAGVLEAKIQKIAKRMEATDA
ncbi:MazG-like family protein [Streptantibioticus silvisoli]|uniref:MazG-like family protein n=1 Tax=Streptantibioticus silvisoli TaxID=2705255 RepID=A0ABT6W7X5_9ACTN|nr:MazG-like family protein [Streptantibioticus silvisoli]MDI5965778.1 MazG-like family protein [Streptantibioticus silvisoli]